MTVLAASSSRRTVFLWALVVFTVGIAADQLTKLWAVTALGDGSSIPLVPTVSLRLAYNPGVAFSLGANAGPTIALGILVILLALTAWIAWKVRARQPILGILLLTVVASGGWGNMFDRATRATDGFLSGHVVDFIAVDWFAIFNFGDVLTVCGMIAWAVYTEFMRDRSNDVAEAGIPAA